MHTDTIAHLRDDYAYLDDMRGKFSAAVEGHSHLFTTDAEGLFEAYLAGFPADQRQHYNCNACRRFIETYGGLVTIDEHGATLSPFWGAGTAFAEYRQSFDNMDRIVTRARVTGVFVTSEKVWGSPKNHDGKRHIDWQHLSVVPPARLVYAGRVLTPNQAAAEKAQDFQTVSRALGEFPISALSQVVSLLESDALYRSEKVLGQAVWLRDRLTERGATKDTREKNNRLWRAIASAPAGFCHPRSSMIGTLLDDIAAGMEFAQVAERFKAKMHPLQYQRPQAAPAAGTIAQAEKLVEQLGIARSLRRRFARLDEVEAIWRPAGDAAPTGGVFGNIKPKGAELPDPMQVPPRAITWVKFARDVLPEAKAIDVRCNYSDNFCVLVTAVDPDAPPILQWDNEGARNPVSAYIWYGGSTAAQHRAKVGYNRVAAVTLRPHQWGGRSDMGHQGEGVIFLIEGATETRNEGLALFPEHLRFELHSVRPVIEAYSRQSQLEGIEQASAVGIRGDKGGRLDIFVRVTNKAGVVAEYHIDRWE